MFAEYWETIVAIGTPTIGIVIIGGIKYIKNKLASNVAASVFSNLRDTLGPEEYGALMTWLKSVGVRKAVKVGSDVLEQLRQVNDILPLIVAMSKNHLAMGVYDASPELKEIVERTIANVE